MLYRRCGAAYHVRRLERERPAEQAASSRKAAKAAILLSKREHEIASLAARGQSNSSIARELWISPKTVEKHLASVYQKLGLSSRAQLDAYVGADR